MAQVLLKYLRYEEHNNAVEKLKNENKGNNVEAIKAATDELTQLFYKMSEKLYQQANPQGAQGGYDPNMGGNPGGGQAGGPNGQQYYDADYTVVDDDKK